MSERAWPESKVREFVGWLSAEIPELHGVEVPRLAAAMEKFDGLSTLMSFSLYPNAEPVPNGYGGNCRIRNGRCMICGDPPESQTP
jgi:hypothetical protein